MDDSEVFTAFARAMWRAETILYRHLDKTEGGDKLIYNIIVNSQPDPTGGWTQEIAIELEVDLNPEFVELFGEGAVVRSTIEGSDWSITALDAELREFLNAAYTDRNITPPG